jgi:hypothetical protein
MNRPFSNPLPGIPHVESPFFTSLFREDDCPPDVLCIARDLHQNGFAVLDFPDPELPQRAERIVAGLGPRLTQTGGGTLAPGQRLQDAWREHADVAAIACNPAILQLLRVLYGREPFPFQTLNFPHGTQQPYHSDAVHFHSVPERYMCGVWLALEDIGPDQGPLEYYPGSHRWPVLGNEQLMRTNVSGARNTQQVFARAWQGMVEAAGLQPATFCARKGQALIWSANLLHGGMPHRDPTRTRWSQVTHYYFKDCAYYTPMESEPFRGTIRFRHPMNILTGEREGDYCNGARMSEDFMALAVSGAWEVMDPKDFDAAAYLRANPDVAEAGVDAWEHYLRFGRSEGRVRQ